MAFFDKIVSTGTSIVDKMISPISNIVDKTLGTILRPMTDFIKLPEIMNLAGQYKNIAGIHDFLQKIPYVNSYIHNIDTLESILNDVSRGNYSQAIVKASEYGIEQAVIELVPLKYRLSDELLKEAIRVGKSKLERKIEKSKDENTTTERPIDRYKKYQAEQEREKQMNIERLPPKRKFVGRDGVIVV